MYTPQNESELKKDVDFDINHRVADFEAIRLRLDNSPEKYGNAKEDLIRWDNQKITPLELGKKLQSPEYKTAFENALHEQYKPGLEGGFGHSFNGSDKEKSAQFVAMRIAGIESAIRVAEKYKEIRANMGKGVNKEPEKAQTRDFER